jgi:small subunit ribosomal protein S15
MAILAEAKTQVISTNRRHATDVGSPEVQIALLTARIKEVAEHLKGHLKDNHSRRGLVQMVSKRNRLLRYLARVNPDSYKTLIKRLELRK